MKTHCEREIQKEKNKIVTYEKLLCGNSGQVIREVIDMGDVYLIKKELFCSLCGYAVRDQYIKK